MRKRIALSIEASRILKRLIYTLVFLILASTSYFFVKTSSVAEKGANMEENRRAKMHLESDQRLLRQRLLEEQSINKIQSSKVVKEMIQPENQTYVLPRGPLTRSRVKYNDKKL